MSPPGAWISGPATAGISAVESTSLAEHSLRCTHASERPSSQTQYLYATFVRRFLYKTDKTQSPCLQVLSNSLQSIRLLSAPSDSLARSVVVRRGTRGIAH
jgi:hypothetical protein